jgi:Guanylate kinase
MRRKLLVLAGPSGCGKNYMTDELVKVFPEMFEQLPQYTTRPKRTPDENTYYFITDEHYSAIKSTLIAKTYINSFSYGTVPCMKKDRIGIIIANRMGIDNLNEYLRDNDVDYDVCYLGIDSEIPAKREDRSEAYVEEERNLLSEVVDYWLVNTEEKYITVKDVINELKRIGFIETQDLRHTQVKKNDEWVDTRIQNTRTNDTIRMFEPDGTPVVYNGTSFSDVTEYLVISNPVFNEEIGRWAVEVSVSVDTIKEKYMHWLGDTKEEFEAFFEDYPYYKPFKEELSEHFSK